MDQVLHGADHSHDPPFHRGLKLRAVHVQPRLGGGVGLHVAYPAVQHQSERTALGLRLHAEVAQQLAIGGEPLALGALKPPLGRQVGVGHHKIAVHHMVADGLEQERLPAAIASHYEAERGSPLPHYVHIVEQGLNLLAAPHGDVGQSDARHNAAFERIDNGLGYSSWYLVHVLISFAMSSL